MVQAASMWTAHSARGVLPSLSADQGRSKSDRDYLGHWQQDGSDTYARNARAAIKNIQREAIKQVLERPLEVDEDELAISVQTFMQDRGTSEEEIAEDTHDYSEMLPPDPQLASLYSFV